MKNVSSVGVRPIQSLVGLINRSVLSAYLASILLLMATPSLAQTIPLTGVQGWTQFVSVPRPRPNFRNLRYWVFEFVPDENATTPAPNPDLLQTQISRLEVWTANASGSRKALYESILYDLRETLAGVVVVRH